MAELEPVNITPGLSNYANSHSIVSSNIAAIGAGFYYLI